MSKSQSLRTVTFIILFGSFSLPHFSISAQTLNEILGRPTDSTITISILVNQQTDLYWEYGTATGTFSNVTDNCTAAKDIPLEVDFTGLIPNTKYYYRTRYRPAGTAVSYLSGPEHTFQTQRAKGSTFTFTIESDEHLYDKKGVRSIYQICLANQAADGPDFMLSLGDIFGDDHQPLTTTSADMDQLHRDYRPYLGSICHSVPFFVCLGNHEGEFDYYLSQTPPDNIGIYGTLWRKFYYPNPFPNRFYSGNTDIEPYGMGNPENYYSGTWGDALFVVLDAYRYQSATSAKPGKWDWTLGYSQYTWLRSTLENSSAKYKFVFAHHTLGQGRGGAKTARYYEWGGYNADGTTWGFDENRPGWGKPVHQLFVDNGVNIFFQGHDHLFAQEVLDGVIYQEVPMPSDSTYQIGMLANADAYISNTVGGTGHLRVSVAPDDVKVDFVRAWLPADTGSLYHNREVAFSYSLKNGPSAVTAAVMEPVSVKVYPNPARDRIYIGLTDTTEKIRATLFSRSGQRILETTQREINLKGIPEGVYFLKIETGGAVVRKKFIISR
ncbi:MAG: metallophosphoesterase [Bacteroidia bacterium]|nr:metallophosphoesterase [Bacteroidia bacterium]